MQGQELCVEEILETARSRTWSSCFQADLAGSGSGKAHQHPNPKASLSAPLAGIIMYWYSQKHPESPEKAALSGKTCLDFGSLQELQGDA